ncbi:MAG: hypothetical protein ACI845_001329, partial [Gammaproteobacteria bacterium]
HDEWDFVDSWMRMNDLQLLSFDIKENNIYSNVRDKNFA